MQTSLTTREMEPQQQICKKIPTLTNNIHKYTYKVVAADLLQCNKRERVFPYLQQQQMALFAATVPVQSFFNLSAPQIDSFTMEWFFSLIRFLTLCTLGFVLHNRRYKK